MRRRLVLEAVALAPALAAGVGLGRLTKAPLAPGTLLPVVACVVAGHLAAAQARRLGGRVAGFVSGLAGTLAVALVSVWWFVGNATTWGVPTTDTARAVGRLLSSAFAVIDATPTPVSAGAGVVLCMAAGAGCVAVGARAVLPADLGSAKHLRLGLALLPSAGLFAYVSLVNSESDRVQAALGYVAAVVLYLVATDGSSWRRAPAVTRPSSSGRVVALRVMSSLAVAGVLAVPLAVSPALAGMRVHAPLYAPPGAGAGRGGVEDPAISEGNLVLADNLDGEPAVASQDVLFVARSPLPTYWQVGTLTNFDGLSWDPDVATLLAADGITPLPPPLPSLGQPSAASTMKVSVTIVHLNGSLLPTPPHPVSASGNGARLEPGIGLDRPAGARPGSTYSVVAASTAAPAVSQGGGAISPGDGDLAPYLQLPALPHAVVALAHRIVAGDRGPLAEATALARFFDSGRFRYSLTAPAGGVDSLEQFLFLTRAGVCQQFAGAYGVLARLDGLPTRIAVGFNAGTEIGKGVYRLTAADAHVWPEVYLGPALGWVSMEPTPLTSNTLSAVGVVYGTSTAPGSGLAAPGVFRNPRTARDSGVGPAASPTVSSPAPLRRPAAGSRNSGSSLPWWPFAVALVMVLAGGLVLGRNRLGDAVDGLRCRGASPSAAVVLRWHQAVRALGRRHLGRRPTETLAEHASRVLASLDSGARDPRANGDGGKGVGPGPAFVELAALASLASYSDQPLTVAEAERARRLGARVRSAMGGRAG